MGQFRVMLEGVGGHGCQREIKDGGKVFGCRRLDCPDCVTQEYVNKMHELFSGVKAELIHWPGQECEVRDEFVTPSFEAHTGKNSDGSQYKYVSKELGHRIRHGSF